MANPNYMLNNVRSLVCLGDSITELAEGTHGYVQALRRELEPGGGRVINGGVGGSRSTDLRARFETDGLGPKPDLITLSIGVNDVWRHFDRPSDAVPLGVYRRMLEEMAVLAESAQTRLVFLTPTPVGEDLDGEPNRMMQNYIAAMRDVARVHNIAVIDLFEPFAEVLRTFQGHAGKSVLLLTTDGVHMNQAGEAMMTFVVLRGLGVDEA